MIETLLTLEDNFVKHKSQFSSTAS